MITFLKDSMKTVQSKMKFNIENIDTFLENMILHKFESIKINKIYYRKSGKLTMIKKTVYENDNDENVKTFQTAITFELIYADKPVKLRMFHTKPEKTFQISNGFAIEEIEDILTEVSDWIKISHNIDYKLHYILFNGVAQTNPLCLIELSKKLEENGKKFLYTPSRSASLKLYNDLGTACIFSTGKILYMGSKNKVTLMGLHIEVDHFFKKIYL